MASLPFAETHLFANLCPLELDVKMKRRVHYGSLATDGKLLLIEFERLQIQALV